MNPEMNSGLEETLVRELHQVADATLVPPMPALPVQDEQRPHQGRHWQPLVAAAAVVLLVGTLAWVFDGRGETPTPSAPPARTIPVSAPLVPYVVDQRLHVDGQQAPGSWWFVESAGDSWLGQRTDGSWWWGAAGLDPVEIDAELDQPPVLSPDGRFIALIDLSSGNAVLTGFETVPDGQGFGPAPIDLSGANASESLRVRAVTSEGDVIVQGRRTSLMWRAGSQDRQTVVDLSESAPSQQVVAATTAGLIVVDGMDSDPQTIEPRLVEISGEGRLQETGTLPTYDAIDINRAGTRLVRSPSGTLGGEVTATATLRAQTIGELDEITLTAPDGWGFSSGTWSWENDTTVLSVLLPLRGTRSPRLVRCEVTLARCRAFAAPAASDQPAPVQPSPDGAGEPTTYDAESTLAAVIRAVVTDDRASLVDQGVIADAQWDQLVAMADGKGGSGSTCRDNGSGTRDCEIDFQSNPDTVYYTILEPASNAYGWRVGYVGIAHD